MSKLLRDDMICVNIGQVITADAPSMLGSVLGSCVALTLYDSVGKRGGMAHILMSGDDKSGSLRLSDPATRTLISKLRTACGNDSRLVAKLVGGAGSAFAGEDSALRNIGRNTALQVVTILVNEGIDIEGMHIGGSNSRSVVFDLNTGKVTVCIMSAENGKDVEIVI
jgi:chemotaxis protein CheD